VNRNKAVLNLFGDADNDTFEINASLADDQTSNTNTGTGANLVVYNVNAQVNIDGGSGFDTVIVSGTSADDTFTITDHGITGPGLAITTRTSSRFASTRRKATTRSTFRAPMQHAVHARWRLRRRHVQLRQPAARQGGVLVGIQGKVVLIGDSGNARSTSTTPAAAQMRRARSRRPA